MPGNTIQSASARGPLLVIILPSYLMIVLDISTVITALPKIQASLGLSASALSWVQNAYTLAFLPMTLANFAVAVIVPKLTHRFGNAHLLTTGLTLALIGIGQGCTLSPLTSSGIAGAASGLVNVAHQLGGSLGLGVLVVIFAAAPADSSDARIELAQRVATSLTEGSGLLALALTVVILFIVRRPASLVAVVSASPR